MVRVQCVRQVIQMSRRITGRQRAVRCIGLSGSATASLIASERYPNSNIMLVQGFHDRVVPMRWGRDARGLDAYFAMAKPSPKSRSQTRHLALPEARTPREALLESLRHHGPAIIARSRSSTNTSSTIEEVHADAEPLLQNQDHPSAAPKCLARSAMRFTDLASADSTFFRGTGRGATAEEDAATVP